MKVNGNISNLTAGINAKGLEQQKGSEKSSNANSADALLNNESAKVDLSERAKDILRAKEIAMNTSDVDEEKVARLQSLIDSGKYKVDAQAIADRMVDDHLIFDAGSDDE
ncbi:MAG: flagellar biosynthesis anti-sigma factor FlgM [Bdellovibrionales bacterium CG10_big_fil_rev_8_21_14_0_10_45_34]|nr:MAG: flagellar biosynthesis anti-sigma factor FlgM [Bdellovibrionales bacterium CG10_big_fil_rev_8_21_14_0_10_45_34]